MHNDKNHEALQSHSIGDDYPWTIVRKGDSYYYALNCVTGEKSAEFYLWDDNRRAHRKCAAWIYTKKQRDVTYERPEKDIAPLVEYTFLIPLLRDTDRLPHSSSKWEWLDDVLMLRFCGFTTGETVTGRWADSRGLAIEDSSQLYRVAIKASRYNELAEVISSCKKVFDQTTIYLAKTASSVTIT